MTKKTENTPALPECPAMSELAALIIGCQSRTNLPVIADYLEEKYHLNATAQLLRFPELEDVPEGFQLTNQDFNYYPLMTDVFLWIAPGSYWVKDGRENGWLAGTVVGLYAHPNTRMSEWIKMTVWLPGDLKPNILITANELLAKNPLLENARRELAAFVSQGQGERNKQLS